MGKRAGSVKVATVAKAPKKPISEACAANALPELQPNTVLMAELQEAHTRVLADRPDLLRDPDSLRAVVGANPQIAGVGID